MAIERNIGIDAFRMLAFVAVVLIHTFPKTTTEIDSYTVLNLLSRFAVPFFFIASGYFIQKSNAHILIAIKKLFIRVFPVFIIWTIIYWFALEQYKEPVYPKLILYTLISGFPAYHLWFFPALGISGLILICLQKLPSLYLLLIGFVFYAVTLICGTYKDFTGFSTPQFAGHDLKVNYGPFMGLLFMVIGYVIARHNIKAQKIWTVWALIVAGAVLQIIELSFLYEKGIYTAPKDHFVGTILLGTGVFLLAQQFSPSAPVKFIARFGYLSLGAYCIHVLILHYLEKSIDNDSSQNILIIFFAVSVLSILASFVGGKIPFLKKIFV